MHRKTCLIPILNKTCLNFLGQERVMVKALYTSADLKGKRGMKGLLITQVFSIDIT